MLDHAKRLPEAMRCPPELIWRKNCRRCSWVKRVFGDVHDAVDRDAERRVVAFDRGDGGGIGDGEGSVSVSVTLGLKTMVDRQRTSARLRKRR